MNTIRKSLAIMLAIGISRVGATTFESSFLNAPATVLAFATITINLRIQGVDTVHAWNNSTDLGAITFPYQVSFTTVPGLNLVSVQTCDFAGVTRTNSVAIYTGTRLRLFRPQRQ